MLDVEALAAMLAPVISDEVEKAIGPLNARIAELEARKPEPGPAGEKGEHGEPGKDGVSPTAEDIASAFRPAAEELIAERIAKAVAELPPPDKGEKGETGDCGEAGERGNDGKDGNPGKDAANIVEALKDSGELVLTLQDGRLIRTGIRDGEKGKDGSDGFGFDDMDACVLEDDRTIEFSFRRGEEEKAFTFKWPTTIYRNVYRDGEQYEPGDMVTWAGSLWHCDVATKDKPGTESWTLAAKKGRDGKDARKE
jgi:collagen type III alpha